MAHGAEKMTKIHTGKSNQGQPIWMYCHEAHALEEIRAKMATSYTLLWKLKYGGTVRQC